ncbi:MAG TPA: hypothetical protein VGO63_02895 [Candidatus Paceibacterota bacterium]|jgi:hypothetical protein|nr:hypothetical protein [Candidatus Paceibacterota bacterium]
MQKVCKNCKADFEARKEDSIFYEQMKVPVPSYCPGCRMQIRLAFRNERTLYKRGCDLCKTAGVSIYPEGTVFPVYCQKCWWGDGWDPTVYKMDYDKSRPFLEQFAELKNKVPRIGLLVINSTNSDYTNNSAENKNCYLIFASENNEDCMYDRLIHYCKSVIDSVSTYESELCYECIDCKKCFKCMYSERLQDCIDVLFSFDMRNSQNCILCTNGRNMTYCIENVQYSKEEFEKKKSEILSSHENIKKAKERYKELRAKATVKYGLIIKSNNATGDYLFNCYDGVSLFDARNTKNSSYISDAEDSIDCQDCNNLYFKPERCYNVMGTLQSNNCIGCAYPMYCSEVYYSDSCYNCTNCFGCAGLNKKNYYILNKEYSKEEYLKLKEKIVEEMRQEGTYGEFLPPSMSPFGYNETLAKEYFPMDKAEAKEKGFNWQKETSGTYGVETIKQEDMPQTIEEVTEDILNQVLVCKDCKKNFRITKGELDFYKRMNIPLPHKDFECRHQERMSKRNPRQLWHRACMCDKAGHPAHENAGCKNEFETSYSPDRKETIYCETCYQQEVS